MMTGTLVTIDGVLYVRYMTTESAEPKQHTLYWKVLKQSSPYGHPIEDGLSAQYNGDGHWHLGMMRSVYTGPGDTLAEKRIIADVPPPKTKFQTRWKDGQWEKLLKKGWVPA